MQYTNKIIALVDINNCYVSCERIFNPALIDQPVIVLSNNDGCAVSRSNEAKKLGIKMAAPLFQIQELVQKHHVHVLSSNYALYAEMSRRFMKVLAQFVGENEQEIYSVDECFLDLTSLALNHDTTAYCYHILECIAKWLGLPVCIGIGRSKTEAKLANQIAKQYPHYQGVCNLTTMDLCSVEALYQDLDVSEVWGVGRKNHKRLQNLGISTAYDLACSDPQMLRKHFSVVMQRTVMELQGISCIQLETEIPAKKQIISSRSFGQRITELSDLKEAITAYTVEAIKKLRKDHLLCGTVTVFLQSNPFDTSQPYYNKSLSHDFTEATDDFLTMSKVVNLLMEQLYQKEILFKKCGVILNSLEPQKSHIFDLFTDVKKIEENDKLTDTFEHIHEKFGKSKLAIGASALPDRTWAMTRDKMSPNYFQWDGLMVVH